MIYIYSTEENKTLDLVMCTNETLSGVGNFRQKINSAEDGIDGTNSYFRRNSGCSAEQKTLRILFRTLPRKRKNSEFRSVEQKKKQTLGIPFRTLHRKRKQLGIGIKS
jgi:hypothetical protein